MSRGQPSIDHNMYFQYQRGTYGNGATLCMNVWMDRCTCMDSRMTTQIF